MIPASRGRSTSPRFAWTVCARHLTSRTVWEALLDEMPMTALGRTLATMTRVGVIADAVKAVSNMPFGGTDCALPMPYAQALEREVDTFVIYTDSETWAGDIHPAQALREYRRVSGIEARLVVVGMVSNGFSIADAADQGMLDVVTSDTATPQLISDFARGVL